MTAEEFVAALEALGWDREQAALELGVKSKTRISEWKGGRRAVPPYIAAHVQTFLRLRGCYDSDEEWAEYGSPKPKRKKR